MPKRGKRAVLVTGGDPMLATAHAAILALARRRGYRVEVVPGVSIICAAFSLSCLSIYKLGGVATVTYPRGGFTPPGHTTSWNRTCKEVFTRCYFWTSEKTGVLCPLERAPKFCYN